jgi:hypothetical protein
MNEEVYFRPTSEGIKAYNNHYIKLGYPQVKLEVDREGYASMHLWDFMQVFGYYYYIGNMNLPTEGNNIEFRPKA